MSSQYKHPSEVPDEVLLARVKQLVEAITKPGVDPRFELTMRIPAECDRDADIVLSELARRYKLLRNADPATNKTLAPVAKGRYGYTSPTAAHRFLAYCPEQGTEFFATQDEAEDRAFDMISDWLTEDEGWGEDVDKVFVAQIVSRSTQVNRIDRPASEDLDEEGCDGEGLWWGSDIEYRCNYRLLPVVFAAQEGQANG